MTRINHISVACLVYFIAISVTYAQPKSVAQRIEVLLKKRNFAENLMIGSASDDIRLEDGFNLAD
ncbi:MAG: hypothetical protein ABJA76_02530 [Mucilaginibacter sp.]